METAEDLAAMKALGVEPAVAAPPEAVAGYDNHELPPDSLPEGLCDATAATGETDRDEGAPVHPVDSAVDPAVDPEDLAAMASLGVSPVAAAADADVRGYDNADLAATAEELAGQAEAYATVIQRFGLDRVPQASPGGANGPGTVDPLLLLPPPILSPPQENQGARRRMTFASPPCGNGTPGGAVGQPPSAGLLPPPPSPMPSLREAAAAAAAAAGPGSRSSTYGLACGSPGPKPPVSAGTLLTPCSVGMDEIRLGVSLRKATVTPRKQAAKAVDAGTGSVSGQPRISPPRSPNVRPGHTRCRPPPVPHGLTLTHCPLPCAQLFAAIQRSMASRRSGLAEQGGGHQAREEEGSDYEEWD